MKSVRIVVVAGMTAALVLVACDQSTTSPAKWIQFDAIGETLNVAGGHLQTLAVKGSYLYASSGRRVLVIDLDHDPPAVIGQSPIQSGLIQRLRVGNDHLIHDVINRNVRPELFYLRPFYSLGPRRLDLLDRKNPVYPVQRNGGVPDYSAYEYDGRYIYQGFRNWIFIKEYLKPDPDGNPDTRIGEFWEPPGDDVSDFVFFRPGMLLNAVLTNDGSVGGLNVVDVSSPDQPSLRGSLRLNGHPLAVTGRDPLAYVYLTGENERPPFQLAIVSVQDPDQPRLLKIVPLGSGTPTVRARDWNGIVEASLATHDDGVVYITVPGHGFTVVDTRDPATSHVVAVRPDLGTGGLAVDGNRLYSIRDHDNGDVIQELDISNRLEPRLERMIIFPDFGRGATLLMRRGTTLYARFGDVDFRVIDIGDPAAPRTLGRTTIPCCSGAVHPVFRLGRLYWPIGPNVGVVDVSNSSHPKYLGWFEDVGSPMEMGVVDRFGIVPDLRTGLRVLDLDAFPETHVVATLIGLDHPRKALFLDTTAYVLSDVVDMPPETRSRIHVIDLASPEHPILRATIPITNFEVADVFLRGGKLWTFVNKQGTREERKAGAMVFDLTQPLTPKPMGFANWWPFWISRVVMSDHFAMTWGRCLVPFPGRGDYDCVSFCNVDDPQLLACPVITDIKAEMFGNDMVDSENVIYSALPDEGIHVFKLQPLVTPTGLRRPTSTPGPSPLPSATATEHPVPLPFATVVTPTPFGLWSKAYLPSVFNP